jgi:hypothetical protein
MISSHCDYLHNKVEVFTTLKPTLGHKAGLAARMLQSLTTAFGPSSPSPARGNHGSCLAVSCRTVPSWLDFPQLSAHRPSSTACNNGRDCLLRTLRTISATVSAPRPFVVSHLCGPYPLAARKGRIKAELQTKSADSLIVQSVLSSSAIAESRARFGIEPDRLVQIGNRASRGGDVTRTAPPIVPFGCPLTQFRQYEFLNRALGSVAQLFIEHARKVAGTVCETRV